MPHKTSKPALGIQTKIKFKNNTTQYIITLLMRKVVKFNDVKCLNVLFFISVASKFIEPHCIVYGSSLHLISYEKLKLAMRFEYSFNEEKVYVL